jgi:hypothetical protein
MRVLVFRILNAVSSISDKGSCLFRADWWFGGFVKRDVWVRDFRGGVYYNRGGDQRFLRNWGGFNRGTRTRPRGVGTSASHLFGAWVWGPLGHAGLLGQAVTWWPSWKHFVHWSGVGVGGLDGSH